ncbi:MAG: sugar ABC transporter substrate-binding protein [Caldilineaceae bacterium]|jgi:multiple sugar transport system substrate-binding protein|nr:sugar ABC transporter substrate-binding protein [Caldilineaceae bacterium]
MSSQGESLEKRMLSRRDLLRWTAIASTGVVLVACAPSAAPGTASEGGGAAPSVDEAVTLTIFDFGGEADQKIYADAHARFKEAHPNVTIADNFTPVSTWSEYSNKIVTQVAGGQAPDIINIAIEGARLLVSKNVLIPLDDILAGDPTSKELTDDVHPELIKPFNIDGKTWYVPHSWNNMVIYYNTKMFADAKVEPPKADWTWSDFLETAQKMTSGEGDNKVFGFGIPYFNFGLTPWLLTNSTYQLSDDWNKSNLADPKVIEAVQFVHDLVHVHQVSPAVEGTDTSNLFVSGRLAMSGWGHWPIQGFLANDFKDFDVAYWPRNSAGTSVFGVGGWGIGKETPHPDLAWELIRELTSKETIQASADAGVAIPARRSVAESAQFLEFPSNSEIFYGSLDDAKPVASPANFNELETIFMRHMGEVMSGTVSPEAGMMAADEELATAMAKLQG